MAVTFSAFSENSLENIYRPPEAGGFNPETFLVKQSTPTQIIFEASFKGIVIRAESTGSFPVVAPLGTSITDSLSASSGVSITQERSYINNVLYETRVYSQPILASDSFNAQFDATSAIYKKIFAGNDVLIASTITTDAPDDKVAGYDGNDVFYGFGDGGSDLFDGGNGIDTSVYRGAYANYTMSKNMSFWNPTTNRNDLTGIQIIDKTKLDGTDGLVNVERLKFSDTSVALDVGPTQNAGSVYMIYKAAFNRAPDASGMGYWLAQKDAGANIVTNIAQGFVNSAEFTAKYGTNPSNATYIDRLYQNVLGRNGDSGGIAYWNQELDAGRISKAAALVAFATLPEGASNVASIIANGISYTEFVE